MFTTVNQWRFSKSKAGPAVCRTAQRSNLYLLKAYEYSTWQELWRMLRSWMLHRWLEHGHEYAEMEDEREMKGKRKL